MLEVLLGILLVGSLELRVVCSNQCLEHVRFDAILAVVNLGLLLFCLALEVDFLGFLLLRVAATHQTVCQFRDLAHEAGGSKLAALFRDKYKECTVSKCSYASGRYLLTYSGNAKRICRTEFM